MKLAKKILKMNAKSKIKLSKKHVKHLRLTMTISIMEKDSHIMGSMVMLMKTKKNFKNNDIQRTYVIFSKEYNNKHVAWSLLRGKVISQILPNFENDYFIDWEKF